MTKIIIIGSGTVGQATGKGLIKKGHQVVFVDKNSDVIRTLEHEKFTAYLPHELPDIDADVSLFCLPTPSNEDGSVNLGYLSSAIIDHSRWLKNKKEHNYHLVVIRSTVPPGTTRKTLLPLLEFYSNLQVGEDIGLCMQPEFLRAKSAEVDFVNPRLSVIGEFDHISGDRLQEVCSDFGGQIFRVDLETAEFMKYVHNCFNATKISFANEMWLLGQRLGIDANYALQMVVKSAEGFWNPIYGTRGGHPYDGTCLPKDVKGFLSFAKTYDLDMPLLFGTDLINSRMQGLVNHYMKPNINAEEPGHVNLAQISSQPKTGVGLDRMKKPAKRERIQYSSKGWSKIMENP